MVFTYFVYIFILLLSLFFLYFQEKTQIKLFGFICVFIISIILGNRYYVGTDWESYKDIFEAIKLYGFEDFSKLEVLYQILNFISAQISDSYVLFFIIVAFIQFYIPLLAFKRFGLPLYLIYPIYIMLMMSFNLNIIRQSLSFSFFIYALSFLSVSKSYLKYIIYSIVSGLFHYSSFILLPLFLIKNRIFDFLDNVFFKIVLFVISIFIGSYTPFLLSSILSIINIDKYTLNYSGTEDFIMSVSSGYGMILSNVINLLLLLYSNKIAASFHNYDICLLNRIFFIGVILKNLFGLNVFLSRIPICFVSVQIVLLPMLLLYLWNSKTNIQLNRSFAIFIYLVLFLMFLAGIMNSSGGISPFNFVEYGV